jgi:hypothetical protein
MATVTVMARGRMISKSLSTSERFAALVTRAGDLAEFCQSLFPLLVSHSDDYGRLAGDPYTVKHVCHPSSPRPLTDFDAALRFLDAVELIDLYTVFNRQYLQIEQFAQHQHLKLCKRSAIPTHVSTERRERERKESNQRKEREREEREGKRREGADAAPVPSRRARMANGAVCRHSPRCENTTTCIARTIADARKTGS